MKKYILLDTLIEYVCDLRFSNSERVAEILNRIPKADVVSKDELIQNLHYLSKYNTPCPEWVFNVIKNS